jgi:hypothetical protein
MRSPWRWPSWTDSSDGLEFLESSLVTKIAEEWAAFDWLSVVQQLGAQVILPTAAGAGSDPEASGVKSSIS